MGCWYLKQIVFNKDVIMLLHMVAVYGQALVIRLQASGQRMKAHLCTQQGLHYTARLWQIVPRANQQQNASWKCVHWLTDTWRLRVPMAGLSIRLVNACAQSMNRAARLCSAHAAHWCWVSSKWSCSVSTMEELHDLPYIIIIMLHTTNKGANEEEKWMKLRGNVRNVMFKRRMNTIHYDDRILEYLLFVNHNEWKIWYESYHTSNYNQ